jgi:hypothetical protein
VSRSVKAPDPRRSPQTDTMRRSPHHLISGRMESVPKSLMHIARAEKGLQGGMGSILVTGVFSHGPSRSHVPPWNWNPVSVPFVSFRRSSFRLQNGAFRHQAILEIAPERDQQLACDGDDSDAPDTALGASNALAEPDAQRTIGLET